MKWYIFNETTDKPLVWVEGDKRYICEFDTRSDALMFSLEMIKLPIEIDYHYIEKHELIMGLPKWNMSGLIPRQNGETIKLVEWK